MGGVINLYNVTITTIWESVNIFNYVNRISFDSDFIKLYTKTDDYKIAINKIKGIEITECEKV